MDEATLTRKVVKYLNSLPGVVAWKIHQGPYSRAGIPDVLGCQYGEFFAIEMKAPGKEKNVSDLQRNALENVELAGGRAYVMSSLRQVKEVFNGNGGKETEEGT
jgi:Holliday junction resolvase